MRAYILRKCLNVGILNNSNQKHAGNEIPHVEKIGWLYQSIHPRYSSQTEPKSHEISFVHNIYIVFRLSTLCKISKRFDNWETRFCETWALFELRLIDVATDPSSVVVLVQIALLLYYPSHTFFK